MCCCEVSLNGRLGVSIPPKSGVVEWSLYIETHILVYFTHTNTRFNSFQQSLSDFERSILKHWFFLNLLSVGLL